jgi:hypothetical protein
MENWGAAKQWSEHKLGSYVVRNSAFEHAKAGGERLDVVLAELLFGGLLRVADLPDTQANKITAEENRLSSFLAEQ